MAIRMRTVNPHRFGNKFNKTGLLHMYEFEETGIVVVDSDNGHNGSASGATPADAPTSSFYFDPVASPLATVIATNTVQVNPLIGSSSCWLNFTVNDGSTWYLWSLNGINGVMSMWLTINSYAQFKRLFLTVRTPAGGSDYVGWWDNIDQKIFLNTWQHLVVTWNLSTGQYILYVDGVSYAPLNFQINSNIELIDKINIATDRDATTRWAGRLDQMSFFDEIITPTDVAEIRNDGLGKPFNSWSSALKSKAYAVYPFNEKGGVTAVDVAGANDATISSSVVSGVLGYVSTLDGSYDFNGTSDIVTIPWSTDFQFSTNSSFSISAWVKLDNVSGDRTVIRCDASGTRSYWILRISGGIVQLLFGSTTGTIGLVQTGVVIEVGKWYSIVAVRNTATDSSEIFVNGVSVATNPDNSTPWTTTPADLNIGYWGYGASDGLDGSIAQIGLWDRALDLSDASEINLNGSGNLYANWSSALKSSLISLWKLGDEFAVIDVVSGNNGVNYGATINQPGLVGQCYTYDQSAVSHILTNGNINITGGAVRGVSVWAKTSYIGNPITLFYWGTTATNGKFMFRFELTDTIRVASGDGNRLWSFNYHDNNWHHYIITLAGPQSDDAVLYIDGILQTPISTTSITFNTVLAPLYIGVDVNLGTPYDGGIDQLMILNRTLLQFDATYLFNDGNGRAYSEL